MFNYRIKSINDDIKHLQTLLTIIKKYSRKSAELIFEDDLQLEAEAILCEACKQFMKGCCVLYEDIEKRFGIDPYND